MSLKQLELAFSSSHGSVWNTVHEAWVVTKCGTDACRNTCPTNKLDRMGTILTNLDRRSRCRFKMRTVCFYHQDLKNLIICCDTCLPKFIDCV
jgi:hypothetical protein